MKRPFCISEYKIIAHIERFLYSILKNYTNYFINNSKNIQIYTDKSNI